MGFFNLARGPDDFDPLGCRLDFVQRFECVISGEKVEDKTIANLSPPLVLEGHESVKNLLVSKAMDILKSKGANVIRTFTNDTWSGYKDIVNELEFNLIKDTAHTVGLNINSLTKIEEPVGVLDYDKERDLEELVQIFIKELGMTEEQALQNFEVIENSEDFAKEKGYKEVSRKSLDEQMALMGTSVDEMLGS